MARKIEMASVECMKVYRQELNHAFAEFNKALTTESKLHWLAQIRLASGKVLSYAEVAENVLKGEK